MPHTEVTTPRSSCAPLPVNGDLLSAGCPSLDRRSFGGRRRASPVRGWDARPAASVPHWSGSDAAAPLQTCGHGSDFEPREERNRDRARQPGPSRREKQISKYPVLRFAAQKSEKKAQSGFASRLTRARALSVSVVRAALTEEQLSGAHLSSAPALLHRQ